MLKERLLWDFPAVQGAATIVILQAAFLYHKYSVCL